MAALQQLGPLRYLLVPNAFHRLDAPAYKARFPDLRVLAPAGSRTKVEERVHVDGSYADFPKDPDVWLEALPGIAEREGALWVRSDDGLSLVLNDVVMNMDRRKDVLGFLFTSALGSAPGPRVSRLSKLLLVKDRKALRARLEEYAARPGFVRLLVGHDKVSAGAEASAALREAATYL